MEKYYSFPAFLFFTAAGVTVDFPDLPGCNVSTKKPEQVFEAAREVLALHLYGKEREGIDIPKPTAISKLVTPPGAALAMIEAFMPSVRDRSKPRYIKKTLTIPEWLNQEAEAKGVNFSAILQEALKAYLERREL